MPRLVIRLTVALALLAASAGGAAATAVPVELLTNGGFDACAADSCPAWASALRVRTPDAQTPTGFTTFENLSGPDQAFAGLWETGPALQMGAQFPAFLFPLVATSGDRILGYLPDRTEDTVVYQAFSVPEDAQSIRISFDLWLTSHPSQVSSCGLDTDYADAGCLPFANELFRADVLTAGASPFDAGSGVVSELFTGFEAIVFDPPVECEDGDPEPGPCNPWVHFDLDVSGDLTAGEDYLIRFGLSIQQSPIGDPPFPLIDSVSVVSLVPEPSTALLLASGLLALGLRRLRDSD